MIVLFTITLALNLSTMIDVVAFLGWSGQGKLEDFFILDIVAEDPKLLLCSGCHTKFEKTDFRK